MKRASADEYFALVVATLVLLVVLVASFMCIQLYRLRRPKPPCDDTACGYPRGEGFLGTFNYSPSCGSEWLGRRHNECRGITTGTMPSIEVTSKWGGGLCPGILGVPP